MTTRVSGGALAGAQVTIEKLNRTFGDVRAVVDVSFDVRAGEFLTLLGPSGSGKTSTLMMIAGFDYPTSGEIFVNGSPIARLPPYDRNIGMVFQSYALFPHMTVADNIGFPLLMRKHAPKEIADNVARVLDVVNLSGYGDRMPRQLSGGQQQRVALARAIVFNPPLLLMDEPLGALDKQLRARLQIEIKRIQQELGITVIYVTHDQEEALVMSDRIGVMNQGRLLQIGSPDDLYNRPANAFVASFIGETNFLPARVETISQGRATVSVAGHTIEAAAGAARSGDRVSVTVRPEKIELHAVSTPLSGSMNALAARIAQRLFVGEFHRYSLGLPDGSHLEVKQASAAGRPVFEPGAEVMAVWHPADTRLLESGGEGIP